jgi:(E)-4-hydroxy-3-methyl-but-2-enyl pyrophosphate reductase
MKVLVAEKCGFCFGVEHAIQLAQQMLDAGKNVYCLGSLIHNKQVVDRLVESGLCVVDSLDQVPPSPSTNSPEPPTVLIRSHGCRPDLLDEVKNRGFQLADATCVLVKRAQQLVSKLNRQGYQVIIVGDPDHPETRGVIGYAPDVIVVAGPDDLEKLPPTGRWAIISQTTHSAEDFGRIVGLIASRSDYQELKVVNTICRETTRRQESALQLCRQVEVMFVLGSRHSANTSELANICRREGVDTYHLQSWQEFEPLYVVGKKVSGITAGASTPDWIIQEFVENLRRFENKKVNNKTVD